MNPQPGASTPALLLGGSSALLPLEALIALFGDDCFAVSDLQRVGAPLIHLSDAFEGLTGYRRDEALGRDLGFLQHADCDQEGNRSLREALQQGAPCTVVLRNYRRDGSLFWNEQRHYPLRGPDGRIGHLVTLLRDVSERVNVELAQAFVERVAPHQQGGASLFSYSHTVRLAADGTPELNLVWVSEGVEGITGLPAAQLRASGLLGAVHPDDRERLRRRAVRLAQAGREGADTPLQPERYRLLKRDGGSIWVEDHGTVAWVAEAARTSAVHAVARVLEPAVAPPARPAGAPGDASGGSGEPPAGPELQVLDGLTGLPGLSLLHDRTQQAIYRARRSGERVALALIDLDHFAFINDTFGRRAGDELLRTTAGRLRRELRRSDTLVRFGGDTFALLLPNMTEPEGALPVLDKLLAAVQEPIERNGAQLSLSATAGVAIVPDDDTRLAGELIARAEEALERARAAATPFCFHHPELDRRMRERIRLTSELRRALEHDELVLHYQPRVNLQSGRTTSVEALLRWVHPQRGLLKPGAFLAAAEAAGLGGEIFEWVLLQACSQAKRWQRLGDPRRVAINVSGQALERVDFFELIADTLARFDLHPGLLEVELTEGTDMALLNASAPKLRALRRIGVHVALDDFGVAYASLSQLKALPLDSLKIDSSFVRALQGEEEGDEEGGREGDGLALLSAIIALGKSLNLTIVAEGVETSRQNQLLQDLRCDEVQGFLFSQAVPAEYLPRAG